MLENYVYEGGYASTVDSIQQVIDTGKKCTPENIIAVTELPNGQIVWLETGSVGGNGKKAAGLAHILDQHMQDFANNGIAPEQIPDIVFDAITQGELVGTLGEQIPPRPVYLIVYNGKPLYIAVTVGSNGFVVGANPISSDKIKGDKE